MKTTIEISDALFERARSLAKQEHKTLRAVVEEGLRLALQPHARPPRADSFQMPTFGAGGLRDEFACAGWETIRDAMYGDPSLSEKSAGEKRSR